MWIWTSVFLFSCFSTFLIVSGEKVVVHEKRNVHFDFSQEDVVNSERIDADTILPMRISLKQNQYALSNAEDWLMAVADPDSPKFGQHWRQEDVISAFQPLPETVEIVASWLRSQGVENFVQSENKQWLAFDISAEAAEKLLQTEYFERERHGDEKGRVRFEASCDQYKLPLAVSQHVDYIKPGVRPTAIEAATERSRRLLKRFDQAATRTNKRGNDDAQEDISTLVTRGGPLPPITSGLGHCQGLVTSACIRALYNIPIADANLKVSSNNTLGIFETEHETYYQPALNKFFTAFSPEVPNGTSPYYHRVDNQTAKPPTGPNSTYWRDIGGETMFDLDISLPIIYPQNVSLYVVRTPDHFLSSIDRFMDVLDGSYCKKVQAPSSPDSPLQCGVFKPNNVLTLSWGTSEAGLTAAHQHRLCHEMLKLGLQGTSIFFSSGDGGVGAIVKGRSTYNLCKNTNGTGPQLFDPLFPGSCPWITSVGATAIERGNVVNDREISATWWNHYHNESYGGSGGGFSLGFNRPSYQNTAVTQFFKAHNPPWNYFYNGNYKNGTGGYNRGRYNRNGRGYPDVSANGKHIATVWRKQFDRAGGTSASSPTWASITNRIIEERIRAGKGPLGFLNPTLYKNAHAMNDILWGGNGVCKPSDGFRCVEGWDPVTGLGTPDYPKLLDVFMKLP